MNPFKLNQKVLSWKGALAGLFIILFLLPGINAFAATYTTSGAKNASGNPLPWHNQNAWTVIGGGANPNPFPNSNDDVIIMHDLNVWDQGYEFNCKSITFSNTVSGITLTIGSGAVLNVHGNIELASPQTTGQTNTIHMPQGKLVVNGDLRMGYISSNSYKGNARVFVAGHSGAVIGELIVTGQIVNAASNNSAPSVLDVLNEGKLSVGDVLGQTRLITTFSANSTLTLAGTTSVQDLPAVNLGNVYVTNPAGVRVVQNLNTSNLLGDLIIQAGKLENKGFSISGRSASKFEVWNNARIILSGTSTFPTGFSNVILEPTSIVEYQGTGIQNIANQTYGELQVTGGGKKFLPMGYITANKVLVDAELMMDYGGVNIGNGILTLTQTGTISTAGTVNYIKVDALGKMVAQNVGPTGRQGEIAFPVGTSASYTPAYITNDGITNHFSVGVINGVKDYATNVVFNQHFVNKTWEIKQESSNGQANVTLRLQWNDNDEAKPFSRNSCYVSHYTNNMWTRSDQPVDARISMSASMAGISSFSPFSVADGGNPLPVELLYFHAAKKDNGVNLTWETASEKNNKGFDIQASADGRNYETVGYVASKNSNANFSQRYAFLDKTSRSGLVYYRLKQTDFDGTVAYYAAKVVDMGRFSESVAAYPNPFSNRFEVKLQTGTAQDVLLQVTDMTGKTVYKTTPKVVAGQNVIPVELGNNLPAGMYILTAKTAGQVVTTRLVKQ